LHDYNVELDADEIERCFQLRSQHRQPTHPGAILRQEYLTARRVSESRLATDIGVSQRRVKDIVKGKRSITPDTALRLERYFGTSARYWLDLQASYNLEIERVRLGDSLEHEVLVHAEAS
jgi:addiction module HigA family antidote